MPATYDVCESPEPCIFVPGPDACSDPNCPCGEGQGDCDSDAECAPGLICKWNVGANYGWPETRDVCEQPGCPAFVPGPDACTSDCPCDEGQGDCDSDAECAPGLICAWNVGANYGWPATRDVCEQPGGGCPPFVTGPDACTTACPCDEGQGDCDGDNQCAPGLVCAQDVGANYGWPATRDVCEQPGGGPCSVFHPDLTGAGIVAPVRKAKAIVTVTMNAKMGWFVPKTSVPTTVGQQPGMCVSYQADPAIAYWIASSD